MEHRTATDSATEPAQASAVGQAVSSGQALSYPALGAMISGFLGLLGIFLGWFAHDVLVSGGQVVTYVFKGTSDLSGSLAALGAIVAFVGGGAMLLMADPKIRRWATMAAGAGGVFLLVFSVAGLFRASAAVGDVAGLAGSSGAAKSAFGVYLSVLGGVIATAAVTLTLNREKATPTSEGTGE
jgi:hypothetical protein